MPREVDITWDHCKPVHEGNKKVNSCNYCSKVITGGIFRVKHHLAQTSDNVKACATVPEEVATIFKNLLKKRRLDDDDDEADNLEDDGNKISEHGEKKKKENALRINSKKQKTLNAMWKSEDREDVCLKICRLIYGNALPLSIVKSPFFATMIDSIAAFRRGLKLPSYHEIRNTFLMKEVDNVKEKLEIYKMEWKRTGCTIMSDGWTDRKHRSITNFLVNSPKGTVFLKSIDTSSIVKNAENIFDMLKSVVDEVGEENVVQVVTDSAAAYVKAGEMLMREKKQLFWSPCAAHCLDLILMDIGELPTHFEIVNYAKKVTQFIYKHSWLLNLMRKYTKGRDLTRPAVTRFATQYLTLKSVLENRRGLRKMFTSSEWEGCQFARKMEGIEVQDIILAKKEFWDGIKYCLKSTIPLVKVLRLVDGDARPAMGYIYEAMDQAKEKIAQNFDNVESRYNELWDIIDKRWNAQLHRPLHAAGMFLNPKYRYNDRYSMDMEIKKGLYDTIERMVQSKKERAIIDRQLDIYSLGEGEFGRAMAVASRTTKQPALWWESYGGECPELQKVAIRVLSLTCSSTGCERNWSTFDQVHTKRRNRLEQKRLNALVFVKYNLQLELRHEKRKAKDGFDPICLSDLDSDDEWICEQEDPTLPIDTNWMDVHECFKTQEGEASRKIPKKRKRGPRNTQYKGSDMKGKGKGKAILVEEDDEEESDYAYSTDDELDEIDVGNEDGNNGEGRARDDDD